MRLLEKIWVCEGIIGTRLVCVLLGSSILPIRKPKDTEMFAGGTSRVQAGFASTSISHNPVVVSVAHVFRTESPVFEPTQIFMNNTRDCDRVLKEVSRTWKTPRTFKLSAHTSFGRIKPSKMVAETVAVEKDALALTRPMDAVTSPPLPATDIPNAPNAREY